MARVNQEEVGVCSLYRYQIVVLSLKSSLDRRDAINNELGNKGIEFRFFDAISGDHISEKPDYYDSRILAYVSNEVVGCAISHLLIWEECKSQLDYDAYIILEDDVVVSEDFVQKVTELMESSPVDATIIQLQHSSIAVGGKIDKVNQNYYRLQHPVRGTYGYIIAKSMINNLINNSKPFGLKYGGIDTHVGDLALKGIISVYTSREELVRVNPTLVSQIRRSRLWVL